MERTYYAPEAVRFDQSQLENDLAFLMSKYVCAGVQFKEYRDNAVWEATLYRCPDYTIRPFILDHPAYDLLLLEHYYVSREGPSFEPLGRLFCGFRFGNFPGHLGHGERKVLQRHNFYELTIGIGSAVAWVILELKDVSAEKKLRLPWVYIFLALPLCLILVGPAATFALGWGLREEILARDYREKASTDSVASKEHDLFANMQQGRDSWLRVVRNTDFFYDLETFSLDDHNEWVHRAT
ncbi:hypothetical protein APSETT444_005766 [Aspergillus pseudonomiae]